MAKNRKTELELFFEDINGKHAKRANAILLTMSKEDEEVFLNNFWKGMEYVAPKLQRQEIVQEETEQVITIQHVTITPEEAKEQNGE